MANTLRRLDLNLLVTLDALLLENNVTRASERLHLSQSAVSLQLAKLREFFDDPLLLPGPRGMKPTSRADELREPLRQALASLSDVVILHEPFNALEATQTWRAAAFDYGEFTIILPALAKLRQAAPDTRLAILQCAPALVAKKAEQGEIDIAFLAAYEVPQGMRYQSLFKENYVLAGRTDHPHLKQKPTLAEFCELEHVIVSPDGGGFLGVTDVALAQLHLKRRTVLSIPHFLFLTSVLEHTDLVALVPSRLVQGRDGLKVVESPLEVPGFEMVMVWPERVHREPAHQWLREHIISSI
ncbi:DNA-binding transcriptional LysR family regulator [Rheinheimera pacifica]|uniref:LysR family transcriptional regulator n=1 Tax=Rheinheimera pacifica TaxID=173990 RepID=UPI002864FBA0|nr:LysR family transcriptional regulator [Rheinheimera pacifica]MDR6983458.1 DNA-binding transcriptional LysR family regulator [Rheinheimera pacifica]